MVGAFVIAAAVVASQVGRFVASGRPARRYGYERAPDLCGSPLVLGFGLLLCVGPVMRDAGGLVSWSYRLHKRLPIMGRLYRTFDTYRYVAAIPFVGMGSIFVVLGVVLLLRTTV
jgi:hypothetical protein